MKNKICIVIANYYPDISNNLLIGAAKILNDNGNKKFHKILTPGIFEIPIIISKNIKKYDSFIALGCVIKGETPHFNFITKSTFDALMHLSITFKKPIGIGILTCLNKDQALLRSNPKKKDKGGEAARAIISVLSN